LLHLSHPVDLIFVPRFTPAIVTYLRSVSSDHSYMFINLFGSHSSVRLRPKHHLLVHLPSVIWKSGPLVGMSCLCYELKNSFSNVLHTLFATSLISVIHLHDIAINNVLYIPYCHMNMFVIHQSLVLR